MVSISWRADFCGKNFVAFEMPHEICHKKNVANTKTW